MTPTAAVAPSSNPANTSTTSSLMSVSLAEGCTSLQRKNVRSGVTETVNRMTVNAGGRRQYRDAVKPTSARLTKVSGAGVVEGLASEMVRGLYERE